MADPREYYNDQAEMLRVAMDRSLSTVWTALPVRILEDSNGHICKAQSLIKVWQRDDQAGTMKPVEMSYFGEVPITYAQGGGFVITHPVKKGDEGIAIFSARNIDGWWQKGGVQAEPFRRRHHLSDAMYIPGIRSNPRMIGGGGNGASQQASGKPPSTTSVQIRTDDGTYYIELTSTDVNIVCENCTVTAGNNVTVNCQNDVTINAQDKIVLNTPVVEVTGDLVVGGGAWGGGNCTINGNMRTNGEVTARSGAGFNPGGGLLPGAKESGNAAGSVSLSTHVHQDTQPGPSESGPPLPGS